MSAQSHNNSLQDDFRRQIDRLTEVGIALSAELHLDTLLEKTLRYARELTSADAGTLYLIQNEQLHFKILQNQWAYAREYFSNKERMAELARFMRYYNHRRPHDGIGGMVPASRV